MGIFPKKSCVLNPTNPLAISGNPNPSSWTLLNINQYKNAYILHVKYHDCNNFEGEKIMVYLGKYKVVDFLDPHFAENDNSPIARFKPTTLGMKLAKRFAEGL